MMTRLLRIKRAVAGVLGTHCCVCGEPGHWPGSWLDGAPGGASRPLQVGHPKGRRWSIRRVNTTTRWMRYLREALRGLVQAECGPCNRKHGGALRYKGRKDKTRQGAKRKLAKLSAEAAKYLMEHGNEEQRHRAAKFVLDAVPKGGRS